MIFREMDMKLNEQDKRLHDRATKVRRMTDRQLCEFLDAEYRRGHEEGKTMGVLVTPGTSPTEHVGAFIGYLETRLEEKNGIGRGTICQLWRELSKAVEAGVFKTEK